MEYMSACSVSGFAIQCLRCLPRGWIVGTTVLLMAGVMLHDMNLNYGARPSLIATGGGYGGGDVTTSLSDLIPHCRRLCCHRLRELRSLTSDVYDIDIFLPPK